MDPIELSDDKADSEETEFFVFCWHLKSTPDKWNMVEQLTKEWTVPVYAFFRPIPTIKYVDGLHSYMFQWAAFECMHKARGVCRFLDKEDEKSTSNMHKHAKKCWGDVVVMSTDSTKNANELWATTVMGTLNPQLIMAAFEWNGKEKVKYLHRQHTKTEARAKLSNESLKANSPSKLPQIVDFRA